jgi:hypothetical protein
MELEKFLRMVAEVKELVLGNLATLEAAREVAPRLTEDQRHEVAETILRGVRAMAEAGSATPLAASPPSPPTPPRQPN